LILPHHYLDVLTITINPALVLRAVCSQVCAKNWQNCQVAAATAAWWGTARLVSWLNIGYYYPIFTLMFMMLLAVLSLQREESFSKKT
jgi:hypothetical protein